MRLWQLHIGKEMKGKTFYPYSSIPWSQKWALQDDLPIFAVLLENIQYVGFICYVSLWGICFFPSRRPVRIGKILQLAESSISLVKLILTHL
jgi:hypothetical protein